VNHGVIWHALCTAVVLHVKPCSARNHVAVDHVYEYLMSSHALGTPCAGSARGLHGFATFLRHYINQRVACSLILLESTTKYERNRILCLRTALASVKSEPGEFCV